MTSLVFNFLVKDGQICQQGRVINQTQWLVEHHEVDINDQLRQSWLCSSGNVSWYERKCGISDGKQGTIILVKWNSELLVKSVPKSIPIISQGRLVTPRDRRQKNLARSGLINCKHNNWREELYNPIYTRSLQKRYHKVVNMRCQFWWPTL